MNLIDCKNRLFVFGGAYGNLQATHAILERARESGYSPQQIIHTGDMIAYCAQPVETSDLLRESGIHLIQGNCEEAIGNQLDDCGCGFEAGSQCDILSAQWYRFCNDALDAEIQRWMQSLPKSLCVRLGKFRLLCTHATPSSINEFVFSSDLKTGKLKPEADDGFDGFIVGHSGLPFVAKLNGKAWINSGAAGMPANDGTSRVWYATVEVREGQLIAETHAVDYDHQVAIDAMNDAGLSNGYCECLSSGIWPSHDVLPDEERRLAGQPIQPQIMTF